ncbi:hypothetical protein FEM48_Zijuj09G0143000 [Ziziphus jujuba var. spinosa]|uniref:Uncharacterized protein n=1 Tax=Ziziphus jujuba var. spinosa TaxID=714518 RepID=A0A978UTG7_ZIZJJ|nr:hypothetical protein FEM48_Zijuj09G0143000 [Ziziphus jujuba var. spinosa]
MKAMKLLENDEEIANMMGNLNKRDNQISSNVPSDECSVLNPPIIRAKGVTNARIKNSLEKREKKSAKVGSSSQSSRPNTMSFGSDNQGITSEENIIDFKDMSMTMSNFGRACRQGLGEDGLGNSRANIAGADDGDFGVAFG